MAEGLDLDAYLARIGYDGPRKPTARVLADLHRLHPAAIPFENLDPLLGRPPRLDLGSLQAKMVAGRRGGYCYEQNLLFKAALEALGFAVTGLGARVLWDRPADAPPRGRSHMLLKVELDGGPMIADVCFGGLVLTAPLKLKPGVLQKTPHEPHKLIPTEDGLELRVRLGARWTPLYSFGLEPYLFGDYEMMNWFCATHPTSIFTYNMMAARVTEAGRVTLNNTRLTHRPVGGEPRERQLVSVEELRAALEADFGIAAPAGLDQLTGIIDLQAA